MDVLFTILFTIGILVTLGTFFLMFYAKLMTYPGGLRRKTKTRDTPHRKENDFQ
jgi:hypothetical protein